VRRPLTCVATLRQHTAPSDVTAAHWKRLLRDSVSAKQEISIRTKDGFALAGTLFSGVAVPKAIVLVGSACGVSQRRYRAYAEFLSERGLAAVTWDWRGIGGSRPARLRGFRASMSIWGKQDFAGVIDWAMAHSPSLPLLVVGHSFTGQSLGMAPNAGRVEAMISIAAPNGYWRY
jgi:predicted alpha/beta hydrolase